MHLQLPLSVITLTGDKPTEGINTFFHLIKTGGTYLLNTETLKKSIKDLYAFLKVSVHVLSL